MGDGQSSNFRSAGYAWRLVCGEAVIEAHLAEALARAGAARAFVVTSPSLTRHTSTIDRIGSALGGRLVGVFDRIERDSSYASVSAARDAARAAKADALIAVGGGSVLVAARAVAIFLGESGDPFELMTQYPPGAAPFSPKLAAPKLPIVNIPTTPNSAMNRAGTGLKNADLDHRMEYFDPKTRPAAILIDDAALMATPATMLRSTATTVFAGTFAAMTEPPANPLVDGDQRQAFRLAHDAYRALADGADTTTLRRDLCLAALLQNRAEDDGRPVVRSGPFAGDYAVSTALHLAYPHIGQGEATAVVHAPAIRLVRDIDETAARRAANALDLPHDGKGPRTTAHAVAAKLEEIYRALGMPARLRDCGVPRDALAGIAALTVKNFNARGSMTSREQRVAGSLALLEAAW